MTYTEANVAEQKLLDVNETCKVLNIGRTTLFTLQSKGKIHGLKILNKRLFHIDEVERFMSDAQADEECEDVD
jgi:excisionase family DNA binding protein